jgi:membrane-associated phospholipid phosphatase
MTPILDWGVRVVLWFQRFHPALDLPFKALTFLGEEEAFMLLLPLLYWCLERRTGIRLIVLYLFSTWVNAVAKALGGQPRPFEYDPRVQALVQATGEGFPSGHTQSATVLWGYLATQFRQKWVRVLAAVLIIGIPLSRVYLGVHFPTDVLGGCVIGAVLLWMYLRWEPGAEDWLKAKGLALQLGLVLVVPAVLALLAPASAQDTISATGTLVGMGVGFVFEGRLVRFDSGGAWVKRGLRFVLGVAVVFALRFGLKAAFAALQPEPVFRFVRYAAMGLWGGLGAPWAFVRLRLAERR